MCESKTQQRDIENKGKIKGKREIFIRSSECGIN